MKHKSLLINILKFVMVVLLIAAIVSQVFWVENFKKAWQLFTGNISVHAYLLLVIIFLLMFLNWALEAKKWQLLVNKVEPINFLVAYKAIFSGVSFAMITPNRIGEYGGRLFYIKKAGVINTITVTLIGSFSQIITTLFFGLIGLMFYIIIFASQNIYVNAAIYFASLFTISVLVFCFFNLPLVYQAIKDLKLFRKFSTYLQIISKYSVKEFSRVLLFSVLRYITFLIQYLLLLDLFGVKDTNLHKVVMVQLIFLVQTLVPSFAIAELGIRGNVALFFLGRISDNSIGIWSAASSLWLINLVIPSLIGSYFILKLKTNK